MNLAAGQGDRSQPKAWGSLRASGRRDGAAAPRGEGAGRAPAGDCRETEARTGRSKGPRLQGRATGVIGGMEDSSERDCFV